jgi:hypothetical protein
MRILIIFLLLGLPLHAAEYFVAQNGSATAPYDTPAKAATSINTITALPPSPDDIITVCANTAGGTVTYTGYWAIPEAASGTAGHPIILRGRTGDTVILDAAGAQSYAFLPNGADYWHVSNLTINGGTNGNVGPYATTTCTGWTFSNITMTSGRKGFYTATGSDRIIADWIIEDCTITGLTDTAIWLSDAAGAIVRRCTISGCGAAGVASHGIYIDEISPNVTLEDNIIQNQVGTGDGIKLSGNPETENTSVIRRNRIADTGVNGIEIQMEEGEITNINNNIISSGGGMQNAMLFTWATDSTVFNNTVSGTFTGSVFRMDNDDAERTIVFYNNIFSGTATLVFNTNATYTTLTSNNNVFNGGTNFCSYGGSTRTFAQWQGYGYDADSLNATDPLFVSASDLHLQATSPAVGAGLNTPFTGVASATDHEGSPITDSDGTIFSRWRNGVQVDIVDIGAYQSSDDLSIVLGSTTLWTAKGGYFSETSPYVWSTTTTGYTLIPSGTGDVNCNTTISLKTRSPSITLTDGDGVAITQNMPLGSGGTTIILP